MNSGERQTVRERLHEIIEVAKPDDSASMAYDLLMMTAIVVSILPLTVKQPGAVFTVTDAITTVLFIIDYVLRFATADYKLGKKGVSSFIKYPFTPMAIIDLISILPALTVLSSSFKLLRLFRIFRTFRVFRVFKALRYSKSIAIIGNVIRNSRYALMAVCTLALGYILVSALVIFNIESDSFDTFFDAIYWATVSLTTVGYGDIYPVTDAGRVITMISSLFGIAIVALPAGIITAGYMRALNEETDDSVKADISYGHPYRNNGIYTYNKEENDMEMELFEAINSRHSYRGEYLSDPVPREHLAAIMKAGVAAPSGCNKQTTSFIAIDDPATLDAVKALIDPPIGETAPAFICVLTRRIIAYRDRCFSVQDYAAAIENMLLAAVALGYRSCWYEGHVTDDDRIGDKIARLLGVPEEYELVCVLPIGIPAESDTAPSKQPFSERMWFNGFKGE